MGADGCVFAYLNMDAKSARDHGWARKKCLPVRTRAHAAATIATVWYAAAIATLWKKLVI